MRCELFTHNLAYELLGYGLLTEHIGQCFAALGYRAPTTICSLVSVYETFLFIALLGCCLRATLGPRLKLLGLGHPANPRGLARNKENENQPPARERRARFPP